MKKHAKLLVLVLSLALIIGAIAVIASADNANAAIIGETEYATIEQAITAAQNNEVVKLIANAQVAESITIDKSITIDLNGKTLTAPHQAFKVASAVELSITGEGTINVAGAIIHSDAKTAAPTASIVGTGMGIKVVQKVEEKGSVVSVQAGNFTFKNVVFDLDVKNGSSAFAIGDAATVTFDCCQIYEWESNNNKEDRLIWVGSGMAAKINFLNSYVEYGPRFFYSSNTLPETQLNLENTTVVYKLGAEINEEAEQKYSSITGNGAMTVNLKNSYFEYGFRFIEISTVAGVDGIANANVTEGSILRHSGRPYGLFGGNNEVARFGVVAFDATSKCILPTGYGVSHDTSGNNGAVTVSEGTRVSDPTPFKKGAATFPDGSAVASSTTYTFAFDPATDNEAAYVVVKVGEEPTTTNTVAGGVYQYDSMTNLTSNSNEGYIYKDGDATVYRSTSAQGIGIGTSQYNVGGGYSTGTMMLVEYGDNTAVKYWAPPTEEYPAGTMRPIHKNDANKNKPCLFVGSGTSVAAASNALVVYSMDIATDTNYFALTRIRISSQMSQGSTTNLFLLNTNGTLTETANLKQNAATSDTMSDLSQVKFVPGQWYRITAMVDTANAVIHVYVDGQYYGSVNSNITGSINGFRLDIAANDITADSALLIDNVSIAAFATAPTVTSYKDLVLNTAANGPIESKNFLAAGQLYTDANEAIAAATAKGTVAYLVGDVNTATKIESNGYVVTNGYTLNVAEGSYGADIQYENDIPSLYIFDESYNDLTVNYLWHNGVGDIYDDTSYITTKVGVGQVPTAPESIVNTKFTSKDEATGKYYVSAVVGFNTSGEGAPEEFHPVTIAEALKAAATPNYTVTLYPVFGNPAIQDFDMVVIDTATGNFKRGYSPNSDLVWGSRLRDELKLTVGETLVLCSSEVRWSDGFNQTKFGQGEVCIDLNGYTMNINGASNDLRKITSFFNVGVGMTLNVYSSRQGGKIEARGLNDSGITLKSQWQGTNPATPETAYTAGTSGGALFTLIPANQDHASNNGDTNHNAHLNIGAYNGMYSGNLTIEGATIAVANSGDKTCSMTIDGATIIRNSSDYAAAIMTRYFYGTVTVKNSTLYSAVDYSIFGAHGMAATFDTDEDGKKKVNENGEYILLESPTNTFNIDNCFIIVKLNGGRIFGNNTEAMGTVTITNSVTNGNIQASSNYDKKNIIAGEGVCSYRMDPSCYAEGVVPAAYNVPMTVAGGSLDIPYIFVESTKANPGTIKFEADIQDLVYKVASYGSTEEGVYVLPLLTYKTVKAEDAVKVTFKGIGTNADVVVDYAKGGVIIAPAIAGATGEVFSLVHDGTFAEAIPETVTEAITLTPNVKANVAINGIKTNLSVYSDFVINLYIPATYAQYVTKITDGQNVLDTANVTIGEVEYIKVSIARNADDASKNATFVLTVKEGDQIGAATVTVSVASYAEKVLGDTVTTAADKQLMYYVLNYANEASKYFDGAADATVAALLETYADVKGEVAEQTYANAIAELALGQVFDSASVKLTSAPAFVLTLKEGFAGTVTVTYGDKTRTYVVTAEDEREIVVAGMKAYNFGLNITVNAEGTIGEEAVATENAQYNLDTFVKYHVESADPASVACVDLLKALYDYVACATAYKA